jgi:nitric oxide reductase subunit C
MLSKSAARTFFVAGTGVCAAAFLGLTFDTLAKVPERSKAAQMTESVRRGHDLWTDNNCMGCHTLLGEGAYYAPELTQVVNRRGAAWIKTFLKDPEAMFPGKRKMVRYDFTDRDRDDLVAFFSWVGEIDTNGFPPTPVYRMTGGPAVAAAPMKGTPPPTFEQVCVACHALGGKGGANASRICSSPRACCCSRCRSSTASSWPSPTWATTGCIRGSRSTWRGRRTPTCWWCGCSPASWGRPTTSSPKRPSASCTAKLAVVQWAALVITGVVAIIGFHMNWWEGRKFLEIPRPLDFLVVVDVLLFIFNVGMTAFHGRRYTTTSIGAVGRAGRRGAALPAGHDHL